MIEGIDELTLERKVNPLGDNHVLGESNVIGELMRAVQDGRCTNHTCSGIRREK